MEKKKFESESRKEKKINAVILRCFNAYGLRQKSISQYAAVVPKFISNAKKNGYLKLNNGGNQSRDFVYIDDICKACGISKKTIYKHYSDKHALANKSLEFHYDKLFKEINSILQNSSNAIETFFKIF